VSNSLNQYNGHLIACFFNRELAFSFQYLPLVALKQRRKSPFQVKFGTYERQASNSARMDGQKDPAGKT
jgi:hypothetical protein